MRFILSLSFSVKRPSFVIISICFMVTKNRFELPSFGEKATCCRRPSFKINCDYEKKLIIIKYLTTEVVFLGSCQSVRVEHFVWIKQRHQPNNLKLLQLQSLKFGRMVMQYVQMSSSYLFITFYIFLYTGDQLHFSISALRMHNNRLSFFAD